jgi:hypothetical protein
MKKTRIFIVQKRSISSTFISALSPFSSGSHDLTSLWMDGDEVREEREHDGDDSVERARRDTCTAIRVTRRLDAAGTPYRNCIRLIDQSRFLK